MIDELIHVLERIETDAAEALARIARGDAPKGSAALNRIRGEAHGARFWAELKLAERRAAAAGNVEVA